jgi:hypothetical protein
MARPMTYSPPLHTSFDASVDVIEARKARRILLALRPAVRGWQESVELRGMEPGGSFGATRHRACGTEPPNFRRSASNERD